MKIIWFLLCIEGRDKKLLYGVLWKANWVEKWVYVNIWTIIRVRKGKKRGHSKSVKIESRIGSSVFSFFMSIYFFDKDGWMLLWNLCAQLYRNSPKLSDMMKLPIFKHKVQDVDFTTSTFSQRFNVELIVANKP